MNTPKKTIALAFVLALAAGCKKNPVETGDVTTTSVTTETNRNEPALGANEAEFIRKANEGGMLEVKLGAAAAQIGHTPDVKSLGSRIGSDRGRLNTELQDLALQKGVVLSTQLDDGDLQKVYGLRGLSGSKFDRAYANSMVDDQAAAVDAFEKASKDLKDPELRAWAAKTLPTLETDLQLAKDAKAKVR